MPLVKRFEDLMAWQEARILNQRIYKLCQSAEIARDFRLREQLRGAVLSVMTNIAEGFDCESNVEFARFLGMPAVQQWKCNRCSTLHWMRIISIRKPLTLIIRKLPKRRL